MGLASFRYNLLSRLMYLFLIYYYLIIFVLSIEKNEFFLFFYISKLFFHANYKFYHLHSIILK